MTVLVLTHEVEPQVDRVVEELGRRRVPVFRTDLAAFPRSLTLDARLSSSGWQGRLATPHRAVELSEVRSVWYRHPSHFIDGVSTTMHLFQRFVDKAFEVRMTVVGEQVFAAAIHSSTYAARIDFRRDYGALTYERITPPADVARAVRRFLAAFDLTFGAFDFAVEPDGRWIFFECNPFGQYGWLEDALDFPLTAAIADVLARETR